LVIERSERPRAQAERQGKVYNDHATAFGFHGVCASLLDIERDGQPVNGIVSIPLTQEKKKDDC